MTYFRASEILTGRIIEVMTDLGPFEPYEEGKKRNQEKGEHTYSISELPGKSKARLLI